MFYVLSQNLVHGDALTMRTHDGAPITFAEWGNLEKGKFKRRDFRLRSLTRAAEHARDAAFFGPQGTHEVFTPVKDYPPITVRELAATTCSAPKEAV